MRRKGPAGNMSDVGRTNSHSARGIVGGCQALKLRSRKHAASRAILTRSCRREDHDPQGQDLHIFQQIAPIV